MTTMQKLSKKTILVAVALIALLILLQFVFTQPKPPLNAGIAVGGTLSNLHFESSSEGERIKALDR